MSEGTVDLLGCGMNQKRRVCLRGLLLLLSEKTFPVGH